MSNNPAPPDLAAIRARRAAITPGPWYQVGSPWGDGTQIYAYNEDPNAGRFVADVNPMDFDAEESEVKGERDMIADAEFIAAAPQDIDTLLELVDKQFVIIDRLLNDHEPRIAALEKPLAERVTPPATTAEYITVAWAHVEGRYPYRWQEEGGKWHTVTNIVNDGTTDEYEIWFESIDPAAWAVVRRTEKLLRGGAL